MERAAARHSPGTDAYDRDGDTSGLAMVAAVKDEVREWCHGSPSEALIQAVPRPTTGAVRPAGSAAPALREAAVLLARASEAAEADAAAAAAARSRAVALEAELEAAAASARACQAELDAANAAARARESALRAEIASEREGRAELMAELAQLRAAQAASTSASADAAITAGEDRVVAENARLTARAQAYQKVIQKQLRVIKEHEARLHAYGARALSAAHKHSKRRRLSSGTGPGQVDSPVKEAVHNSRGGTAEGPAADANAGGARAVEAGQDEGVVVVLEDPVTPARSAAVGDASPRVWPAGQDACADEGAGAATAEPSTRSPAKSGAERQARPDQNQEAMVTWGIVEPTAEKPSRDVVVTSTAAAAGRRADLRSSLKDVPGLRVLEPAWRRGREEALVEAGPDAGLGAPPGAAVRSRTSTTLAIVVAEDAAAGAAQGPPQRAVRAEGMAAVAAAAAMPPPAGPPCRHVVRGKEARLALAAFDCDQCRAFFQATGGTGAGHASAASIAARAAWGRAPRGSRHRFEHAPTNTPPGFWDLSFPRTQGDPPDKTGH